MMEDGDDNRKGASPLQIEYRADGVDGPQEMEINKQQPGTAGPGNMLGCCFVSFHFRCEIHPVQL